MKDVRGIAISPDGQKLAIAAGSNTTEILDVHSWKTVQSFPEIRSAFSVAWDPDDRFVFFGCESGAIYRCEPSKESANKFSHERNSPVIGLHLSNDSKYLAASFSNNQFEVRDSVRNQLLFSAKGAFLRFSEDKVRYAFINNSQVQLAEITDESVCTVIREVVDGITFTPDGNWILTGGVRGMQIFSAMDLQFAGTFKTDLCGPIAIHPNGQELISFGIFSKLWRWPMELQSETGSLRIGPATGLPISKALGKQGHYPHYQGRHTFWSLNGESLAIADYRNGRVLLMRSGQDHDAKEFPQLNAGRVAISPNGEWIASAAAIYPQVSVWSTETSEQLLSVDHAGMVAFSPDGRFLAVSLGNAVELYQTAEWKIVRTFAKSEHTSGTYTAWPIAFQPNGTLLAYSPGPERIQLVEYETGEVVANILGVGKGALSNLCFSPDATRLAFATDAQELGIIDLTILKKGLLTLELQSEKLPDRVTPLNRLGLKVTIERGTEFPAPEQWSAYSLERARLEHLKENVSDAVDAITYGLDSLLPTADADEAARMYVERGRYQQINGSFVAAETDWVASLKIQPGRIDATKYLARLYVLGPPECRKPMQTMQLAAVLSLEPELEQEAMLLKGLAYFRLERWQDCIGCLEEVTQPKHYAMAQLFLSVSLSRCNLAHEAKRAMEAFRRMREDASSEMSTLEQADMLRTQNDFLNQLEGAL